MQIYWSLKHVPELSGLSAAERKQIHRACYSRNFVGSRQFFSAMLACGLCGGFGSAVGHYIPSLFGFSYSIWAGAFGAGIGGAIGGLIFTEVSMHFLRPFYADYIKDELRRDAA